MKCLYNKKDKIYTMGNWEIEGCGGFCTIRHYWAKNLKTNETFWRFKLSETKETINNIFNGIIEYSQIKNLYKKSLY